MHGVVVYVAVPGVGRRGQQKPINGEPIGKEAVTLSDRALRSHRQLESVNYSIKRDTHHLYYTYIDICIPLVW